MNTIRPYLHLMRLDRPIGIFLTLWPALWAVWIAAHGSPSLKMIIIFTLGAAIMRAAGCVINDIADRHFDPHVERTKNRPLASGKISLKKAIATFVVLLVMALILVLQLNLYCLWIALITVTLSILYPFCKRFMYLPQLILGIVFNIGVLMAFAAEQNHLPLIAWTLYISTVIWTVAYDTMYALTDIADDLKLGLKSSAIFFKHHANWIIAVLQILFLVLLAYSGYLYSAGVTFWFAFVIAIGLSIYQQYLTRTQRPFKGFLNNNWLGLIVLIGVVLS